MHTTAVDRAPTSRVRTGTHCVSSASGSPPGREHRLDDLEDVLHLTVASTWARIAKRSVDLLVSAPLCFLTLPIVLLLAVAVWLADRSFPFYCQRRIGRSGQMVPVIKIRSMRPDAEAHLQANPRLAVLYVQSGYKLDPDIDPRITRLGRLLRRSSLDELPQLWCVLFGHMSLVGPRPVLTSEFRSLYGERDGALYLAVKPGLTGLWQTAGRSTITGAERARLDSLYVERWSLRLDFTLLVRTIPAVVRGRGAH